MRPMLKYKHAAADSTRHTRNQSNVLPNTSTNISNSYHHNDFNTTEHSYTRPFDT